MKYVVFGAGRMGRAVLWHLLMSPSTTSVKVVDASQNTLNNITKEVLAEKLGHKVSVEKTDGFPPYDSYVHSENVCIATAGYKSYVELTKACIKKGVSMVDLGGNRDVVLAQKELNDQAKAAGVTIVPDCGLAPGMIGILGMHAFQVLQHHKCTDIDVNMRVGGLPMNPDPKNPFKYTLTWSPDGLINEYQIPADELRNNQLIKVEALTECEEVRINTPWNKVEFEAFVTGGGSSNLPELLQGKARNVNYKTLRYRGHCAIMNGFKHLGFFDDQKQRKSLVDVLEQKLTQPDNDDLVIARAGARGLLGNNKPTIVLYEIFCAKDHKRNFSAMAQTTGYSAAIVAQMIADGSVKTKGVVDGEVAVPGDAFIDRLRKSGIKLEVTQR